MPFTSADLAWLGDSDHPVGWILQHDLMRVLLEAVRQQGSIEERLGPLR